MDSKYTPGPWKIEHGKVYGFHGQYITRDVSDGSHYVARMDGSTMAAFNQDANARLIAAAPDLLAALEKIADGYGPQHGSQYCREMALAAIAKARA